MERFTAGCLLAQLALVPACFVSIDEGKILQDSGWHDSRSRELGSPDVHSTEARPPDKGRDLAAEGAPPDLPPAPDLPPDTTAPVASIVINEMMVDCTFVSDDFGEWIELYNSGSSTVDLKGWQIQDSNSFHVIQPAGAGLPLPPGGYLVLGINGNKATNGNVDVSYQYDSSIKLSNTGDVVTLLDDKSQLVDSVTYTTAWPLIKGQSMALKSPALDNSLPQSWCASTQPWTGSTDKGSPGQPNGCP